MKRNLAVQAFRTACLVMSCMVLASPGTAQIIDSKVPLQDLAQSLETPEAIARFMWRHFIFESDQTHFAREDYWQSPAELFVTRRGDCEDFALFAHELLKRNGIPSFLLNLYGRGYGHTVVIFKEGGIYHALDGVQVVRGRSDSLEGLLDEIYPFWKKAAIVSPSPAHHQGRILKQFERGSRAFSQKAG